MVAESAALLPKLLPAGMMLDEKTETKDPFVERFPLAKRDEWIIRWDQMGAPYGLMGQSVLDAAPRLYVAPGMRVFEVEPGVYREFTKINESYLTKGREPGTLAKPVNPKEEAARVTLYAMDRIIRRIWKIYADLGVLGQINNTNTAGVQQTYQIAGYQKFPVSNWISSPATATPIDDLRAIANTAQRGTDTKFAQDSAILMADELVTALMATAQVRNAFRSEYGASYLAPFDNANVTGVQPPLNGNRSLNALFFGMGLPKIVPWNRGYYSTFADAKNYNKANFNKFLQSAAQSLGYTNAFVWIGDRPKNQQLGQLTFARHAGLEETSGVADFDCIKPKTDGKAEDWAKNLYLKLHYRNRQPNGYDLEYGMNTTPEVWYDDAMLSGLVN
jgi:hypothetical protein